MYRYRLPCLVHRSAITGTRTSYRTVSERQHGSKGPSCPDSRSRAVGATSFNHSLVLDGAIGLHQTFWKLRFCTFASAFRFPEIKFTKRMRLQSREPPWRGDPKLQSADRRFWRSRRISAALSIDYNLASFCSFCGVCSGALVEIEEDPPLSRVQGQADCSVNFGIHNVTVTIRGTVIVPRTAYLNRIRGFFSIRK